jgi:putative transposase
LLRRLYVLVFICIGSRRIEYVACTNNPDSAWMVQQARNLLMDVDDRGQRPRFLIHDRDAKFSRAFDAVFHGEAMRVIRTPFQAPNANAHVERWVGSARRECLDRLLILQPPPTRVRLTRLCPPLQRAQAAPGARATSA